MKKIFIVMVFAFVAFISCKKESQCYSCTYGVHNGYQKPADTFCGDISKYAPKGADGADLSFFCAPK